MERIKAGLALALMATLWFILQSVDSAAAGRIRVECSGWQAGESSQARPVDATEQQRQQRDMSAARQSMVKYEESLIRRTFDKLVLYNRAYNAEHAADGQPFGPDDDIQVLELRILATGPLNEINDKIFDEMVTPGGKSVVMVVRNTTVVNNEVEFASYYVRWHKNDNPYPPDYYRTVGEVLARNPELAEVGMYTSYQVSFRLKGTERTYKALALFHHGLQSIKTSKLTFMDAVIESRGLGLLAGEERPAIRPHMDRFINSPEYKELVRKSKGDAALQAAPDTGRAVSPSATADPCSRVVNDEWDNPVFTKSPSDTNDHKIAVQNPSDPNSPFKQTFHNMWAQLQAGCLYASQPTCQVTCRINFWGAPAYDWWEEYDYTQNPSTYSGLWHGHGFDTKEGYNTATKPGSTADCNAGAGIAVTKCQDQHCVLSVSLTLGAPPATGGYSVVATGSIWTYGITAGRSCAFPHP